MNTEAPISDELQAATRNGCKLCTPLGAALVFKGIRNCLPFLHGSQGCATYIRRYMISHFREPVDIASSSFSEDDAIFGGARNFSTGVDNVIQQYQPEVIGVATTCLSETIGENMLGMIKEYQDHQRASDPPLVHVSTPAYNGTHTDGFYSAIRETIRRFARHTSFKNRRQINILPSMMSCADLVELRRAATLYGLSATILPDYSRTLQGESWAEYHRISPGGTPLQEIEQMSAAHGTIEIGHSQANAAETGGTYLQSAFQVNRHPIGWPIGVRLSDQFYTELSILSGNRMPASLDLERGQLVDAYVDAHKYLSRKRAAIFGDPDLVIGLAAFLSEIGVRPVICATGAKVPQWKQLLQSEIEGGCADVEILSGSDYARISEVARELQPDFLIGPSKGYPLARELGVPLVRIGFPIHDRFGAQRQLSVGYRGTQQLFDRIVNAILDEKQTQSETGYSYL